MTNFNLLYFLVDTEEGKCFMHKVLDSQKQLLLYTLKFPLLKQQSHMQEKQEAINPQKRP